MLYGLLDSCWCCNLLMLQAITEPTWGILARFFLHHITKQVLTTLQKCHLVLGFPRSCNSLYTSENIYLQMSLGIFSWICCSSAFFFFFWHVILEQQRSNWHYSLQPNCASDHKGHLLASWDVRFAVHPLFMYPSRQHSLYPWDCCKEENLSSVQWLCKSSGILESFLSSTRE